MQVCEFASNLWLSAVLPSPVARNLTKQQVGLNVDHLILTWKRDLQVLVSDKEKKAFILAVQKLSHVKVNMLSQQKSRLEPLWVLDREVGTQVIDKDDANNRFWKSTESEY